MDEGCGTGEEGEEAPRRLDPGGGQGGVQWLIRSPMDYGKPPVRPGPAADGMHSLRVVSHRGKYIGLDIIL